MATLDWGWLHMATHTEKEYRKGLVTKELNDIGAKIEMMRTDPPFNDRSDVSIARAMRDGLSLAVRHYDEITDQETLVGEMRKWAETGEKPMPHCETHTEYAPSCLRCIGALSSAAVEAL